MNKHDVPTLISRFSIQNTTEEESAISSWHRKASKQPHWHKRHLYEHLQDPFTYQPHLRVDIRRIVWQAQVGELR